MISQSKNTNTEATRLLGLGLYSVPEAARLTGVRPATIRRWMRGYEYRTRDGEERLSRPIWKREIAEDEALVVTFRDLVEMRFIDAFRRHHVSWKIIRLSAERAAELFRTSHPFSTKRFRTDGRRIFADVAHETGEESVLELVASQFGFKRVLEPFLFRGIELSEDEMAAVRWWPLGRSRDVVLDPKRSFGHPIVSTYGIPTSTLANAHRAADSIEQVARWFETEPAAVQSAVDFEESLAA